MRRAVRTGREALLLELSLYVCLARWILRRPDVPGGTEAVHYGRLASPMIGLFAFASAVEVPIVHVLVPWDSVRLPLLVVGVWSVLWMLGLMAAYRVRPHLVSDTEVRVRNSGRTDVGVPLVAIATAVVDEHDAPGSVRSVHRIDDTLIVAVSGRTNLRLDLVAPTRLSGSRGDVVTCVRLWVDEPRAVAARWQPPEIRDRRSAARW